MRKFVRLTSGLYRIKESISMKINEWFRFCPTHPHGERQRPSPMEMLVFYIIMGFVMAVLAADSLATLMPRSGLPMFIP